MDIVEISVISEAGQYLKRALANPDTYAIRLHKRADGVAVKVNAGMWTHTMDNGGQWL